MQLLSGQRIGNYELRESAEIRFAIIDAGSVIATLLPSGVCESGEDEKEALDNLEWCISDLLHDCSENPNKSLGRRLAQQMKELKRLFTE